MRPTLACCCAAGGGRGSCVEACLRFCPTTLNFLIAIRGPRAGCATFASEALSRARILISSSAVLRRRRTSHTAHPTWRSIVPANRRSGTSSDSGTSGNGGKEGGDEGGSGNSGGGKGEDGGGESGGGGEGGGGESGGGEGEDGGAKGGDGEGDGGEGGGGEGKGGRGDGRSEEPLEPETKLPLSEPDPASLSTRRSVCNSKTWTSCPKPPSS